MNGYWRLLHKFTYVILSLACTAIAQSGTLDQRILNYEPQSATLNGRIVEKSLPGPPNYESIDNGDATETIIFLLLSAPITVVGDADSDLNSRTERDVKVVQITWGGKTPLNSSFIGQEVTASGQLYHAHTAHHRKPILFRISEVHAELGVWTSDFN